MIGKSYVALFVSIISVSFAAIFIVSCTAPALSIAFYRLLFTVLLVLPFVIIHKKTRVELINLPYKSLIIMAIIGLILAAHFALWIKSLELTSIASSVILVTAHPILVGPISHYLFKEKLSIINIIGITASIFGVAVLVFGNYGFEFQGIGALEGNILAILGGAAAGLYILGGRKLRKEVSVASYAFVVYSVATVVLLVLCLFFNAPIYNLSIQDYQIIFLMAVVSGILGHTLYNWSLGYVRASVASVFLLGEPLGSTLLAIAIPWINQLPSKYTVLGGIIILLGIYLTSRKQKESSFRNI
ncbi:MAG: DMT family transporter [Candidatus Thermoplasmatota archaeon]|nr:DMT family transporter [Candidatus Thermoplasmatota archaeon]